MIGLYQEGCRGESGAEHDPPDYHDPFNGKYDYREFQN